jgi:hypothetical protein
MATQASSATRPLAPESPPPAEGGNATGAPMTRLPPPPPIARRFAEPLKVGATLVVLAALPAAAFAGLLDGKARGSVVHVAASFAVLTLAFRVIGKRELGRLSPFELVTLMLIPEILSSALQGEGSLFTSIAGLSMILLLVLLTSVLSQRFPAVQQALEPSPTVLVVDGVMLDHNMNSERIAPDELFSEMRKQGLETLDKVRFAVLESSGAITFVPRVQTARRSEEPDLAPG